MESDERYRQFVASAWTHYAHAKRETHKELDAYLLKFASGAFVLSLTPTIPVFAWSGAVGKGLLFASWVAFAGTIGATLMSFYSSAKACDRQIEISQAVMMEGKTIEEAGPNKPLATTERLNAVSIAAFLAGVALFAAYLWVNF